MCAGSGHHQALSLLFTGGVVCGWEPDLSELGSLWDARNKAWQFLATEGHSWGLGVLPRRLQHCGAPEGHSTPTSTRSSSSQQATPWLLRPAQHQPSLCPQHYHHHKSVSVVGCLTCLRGQGRVPSLSATPKTEASIS